MGFMVLYEARDKKNALLSLRSVGFKNIDFFAINK